MERIPVKGIITLHEIPSEWSDEDFKYWWCPVTDAYGHVIQTARISDEAKAQRIVKRGKNLITNAGIALFLSNLGASGQGTMYPFSQILSVGNGAITGVTRNDPSVAGDGFATGSRKAPASTSTTGFQTTVIANFASTDAVGTWTNIGLYGFNTSTSQNATTTSGTGVLVTHAPYNFVKGSTAYALNYVFLLSN